MTWSFSARNIDVAVGRDRTLGGGYAPSVRPSFRGERGASGKPRELIERTWKVAPPSLSGVIAISSGDKYSLAVKSDGSVAAWGMHQPGPHATHRPLGRHRDLGRGRACARPQNRTLNERVRPRSAANARPLPPRTATSGAQTRRVAVTFADAWGYSSAGRAPAWHAASAERSSFERGTRDSRERFDLSYRLSSSTILARRQAPEMADSR
jgi:hypothetical protein